jgi:hypothetical protein
VNVERGAQQAAAHGRTFDVPARTAGAPRAGPRRFAGLGALPQREVGAGTFAFGHAAAFTLHRFHAAVAQLAVVGRLAHLEVHVAVGLVGKTLLDETLRQGNDLLDVVGAAREAVDGVDAHCGDVAHIIGRHFLGQLAYGNSPLVAFGNELVVHVGDVYHQGDLQAVIDEVTLDGVEDHGADHVADVAGFVDRRTAEVDLHLAGRDGFKGLFALGQRAVDANHFLAKRG